MNMAVETHELSKIYEKPRGWRRVARQKPITAVTNVNLSVPTGELFGLLGPNGAGKTTLVKMLCTLILPTSGAAQVAGHPLADDRAIKAVTGLVVSDERSFFWRLSARRNLAFYASLHGLNGRFADERIKTALAEVDLSGVAEERFSDFSSGMKQRLAIARALLHEPAILFLDEPSRSLDPSATQRLHELIQRLMAHKGMTAFLITHDLAEAEKLCDRVALMHNGRIQQIGRPAELRRHLKPQRVYDVVVAGLETAVTEQLRQEAPGLWVDEIDGLAHIHFSASEEEDTLTAILDKLRRHEIVIHSIEGQPPTLEAVFAHYTRGEN